MPVAGVFVRPMLLLCTAALFACQDAPQQQEAEAGSEAPPAAAPPAPEPPPRRSAEAELLDFLETRCTEERAEIQRLAEAAAPRLSVQEQGAIGRRDVLGLLAEAVGAGTDRIRCGGVLDMMLLGAGRRPGS
jgi:hypothetical protein